jgi:hypothetical protein
VTPTDDWGYPHCSFPRRWPMMASRPFGLHGEGAVMGIIIFAVVVGIIWILVAVDGADSRPDDSESWYPAGPRSAA